jgi:hypothetical protein
MILRQSCSHGVTGAGTGDTGNTAAATNNGTNTGFVAARAGVGSDNNVDNTATATNNGIVGADANGAPPNNQDVTVTKP